MPYKYLDNIATSDMAFLVWEKDLNAMFAFAVDALLNILIEDISAVRAQGRQCVRLEAEALDLLLYAFLDKILFYKDAEALFLRVDTLEVEKQQGKYVLKAQLKGERIDLDRHELYLDIKAITFHQLEVSRRDDFWQTVVVVDV